MPNLSFHGQHKERDEVQEKDGPVDGHIEEVKEGHTEGDERRFSALIPVNSVQEGRRLYATINRIPKCLWAANEA